MIREEKIKIPGNKEVRWALINNRCMVSVYDTKAKKVVIRWTFKHPEDKETSYALAKCISRLFHVYEYDPRELYKLKCYEDSPKYDKELANVKDFIIANIANIEYAEVPIPCTREGEDNKTKVCANCGHEIDDPNHWEYVHKQPWCSYCYENHRYYAIVKIALENKIKDLEESLAKAENYAYDEIKELNNELETLNAELSLWKEDNS